MELFANNIKLPFSGSVTLKFYNPLFNDIGSFSLPIELPSKFAAVNKAFGYFTCEETKDIASVPGMVKTGFLELIGSWAADKGNKDSSLSAYFKPSSGDFYSMIKDVYLQDLDYGGVKWPVGVDQAWGYIIAHLNTKMTASYPDSEYAAFSAYMANAESSGIYGDLRFVNPLEYTSEDTGLPTFESGVYGNFSVYLFVGTVLDYIFNNHGYKIVENIFAKDADLQKAVIFNTFNIKAPLESEYNNLSMIDYKKLVPHRTCGDFLKAVRDRFNIGFFINERSRTVKILSFDQVIAAGVKSSLDGVISRDIENNRLPGIKFPHYQTDAWNTHSYTSKSAELKSPIVVDKYRDILPDTRDHGDLIFVTSEQTYYKIKFTAPSTYEAIRACPNQIDYTEGNGSIEFTQSCGAPAMWTETITKQFVMEEDPWLDTTEVDYLLPRCDLVRNGYELPFTDFPIMFLFARGIQSCYVVPKTGAPTYRYPMGSSDVIDAAGTKISDANLAIKWDGDYGLIEKFWKNRINWQLNIVKLVKADLLSENIAKLIDMEEVKSAGKSNYLVNFIEVEISNKGTRLKSVELLRL